METQQKEKVDLTQEIVKIIKQKESMVRDTMDKKSIVIYEDKEPVRFKRKKEQKNVAEDVVRSVQGESEDGVSEIKEVHRLEKYTEGGKRSLKVKFRTQSTASKVIQHAWRLDKTQQFKKI
ncbi:hypothetical protein E2C01_027324 [Portunus trituberculatus]|uniref:Uncharacterized protein n=1 Tax=Portunus trituberculatus TaxID=210409 RepID=A0A5B7ENF8_PORTR|nr:hypothetical protein [Portunus trituberculatus]